MAVYEMVLLIITPVKELDARAAIEFKLVMYAYGIY